MKILFRCNAGDKYGLGHLVRCAGLAKEFAKAGHDFFFLVKTDNKTKINDLIGAHIKSASKVSFLPENISLEDDLEAVKMHYINGFSFLILDHYDHNYSYQEALLLAGIKWAQFDYSAEKKILADIVINGNISATKELYKGTANSETKFCVGPEYAIIREDFINTKSRPENKRVLIALGGGGYPNHVMNLIHQVVADSTYVFDIVSNDGKLKELLESKQNVNLHINISNVLPIYSRCEVAIVAGGVTTFEMAALNIPMILIPFADNQHLNAVAWDDYNFGINFKSPVFFIDVLQNNDFTFIVKEVFKMFQDRQLSIDGLGSKRIVKEVLKLNHS